MVLGEPHNLRMTPGKENAKPYQSTLYQWFPTLGNPGVHGLQFPEGFTINWSGLLEAEVQEHLDYEGGEL